MIIVIVSIFNIVGELVSTGIDGQLAANFKAIKVLRGLRAVRPLRLIAKSPMMTIVIRSLVSSLPAIGNVAVIILLVMLVFAILGVQLFKVRTISSSSLSKNHPFLLLLPLFALN